jgi:hypothetical protein
MYHIDSWMCFCFHEFCLLLVIISHIWDVTVILCIYGAIGGSSTLLTFALPCIDEATRVTQHYLHRYRHSGFLVVLCASTLGMQILSQA